MTSTDSPMYDPCSQPHCVRCLRISNNCLVLAACFALCQPLYAAAQYCDLRTDLNRVGAGYSKLETAPLDAGTATDVELTRNQAEFDWRVHDNASGSMALGADLQYTIMDFNGITPMTNGHLHTWGVPVRGSYVNHGSSVFYSVTPAISVSSNALRNTDLLDSEALQLNAELIYKNEWQENLAWIFGAMADHRFGDYRLYPVTGVCWRPAPDWVMQLAVPDVSVSKKISSGITLRLYVAAEGNQWHVFSKDEQRSSDLSYKAIVTGISAYWSITPAVMLNLEFVKHTRRKFSLVLDDNSFYEAGAASSTGARLGAEVLF